MTCNLLTSPATEPVSLADVKAYLKLDHDSEDDLLRSFIIAARLHLEHMTGRHFVTQTWRINLEGPLKSKFALPLQPVSSILAVRVLDVENKATELNPDELSLYQAECPAMLANLGGVSLSATQRLQIDLETGFGPTAEDVPEPLRFAMKMVVAEWYERRLIANPDQLPSLANALAPMLAPYRSIRL